MENLALEIFNILKGANIDIRLFDQAGMKTTDVEQATRFYASEKDLMISIRSDNTNLEVVIQAGEDFDVSRNSKLIDIIKKSAHRHMAEFTVRNFGKHIEPKDFAHQSVSETQIEGNIMSESKQKAFGSTKTSYVQFPNSKLIIKHNKSVNEEVRGSRSRNIQSLFIENAQGEKFKFPYKFMSGAKAMAKHVTEGGTPYDEKGTSIIAMCEDIAELSSFVKHVRSNKLISEDNADVVETVKAELHAIKEAVKSLSTQKGYNNFESYTRKSIEEGTDGVDIEQKFMYNTFSNKDMNNSVSLVSALVAEATGRRNMNQELITQVGDMLKSGADLKITIDKNDPEWPDNANPVKFSGSNGPIAKLSALLSYLSMNSKNDEVFNLLAQLSESVHDMDKSQVQFIAKLVRYLIQTANKVEATESVATIAESVELAMRKKIS